MGGHMEKNKQKLFDNVNRAIIKFRAIYFEWSRRHNISYHEMLVLYTIRENGYCTQKQICDNYLLPKQTIHNIISNMRENGILIYDESLSVSREKVFVLSEKGREYAAPFLESLDLVESGAMEILGKEKLNKLIGLLLEYDMALNKALNESR
jgi:DNA-binding MarR family transcriptional regulator